MSECTSVHGSQDFPSSVHKFTFNCVNTYNLACFLRFWGSSSLFIKFLHSIFRNYIIVKKKEFLLLMVSD